MRVFGATCIERTPNNSFERDVGYVVAPPMPLKLTVILYSCYVAKLLAFVAEGYSRFRVARFGGRRKVGGVCTSQSRI